MLAPSSQRGGPIIWPLAAKLRQPLFLQKRPKWTGGRAIPGWPILPWNDSDRPPAIAFGQVEYGLTALDVLPVNLGLCAIGLVSIPLQQFMQPPRPRATAEWARIPTVVRAQPPATMTRFTFSGVSRSGPGDAFGPCRILVFRTYDNVLAAQTVSDLDGNWSVIVDRQQRHFFVEYYHDDQQPDIADLFGTSLNDRVPS